MTRLTYRAVWQVDDLGPDGVGASVETVRKRLGPPAVSAAIDTALHRLLADVSPWQRPEIGAVSVTARGQDGAPLDPDGPFATPSGQDLLAGFLTDLLAWDTGEASGVPEAWPPLNDALRQRARGLLAGLTVEVRTLTPLPADDEQGRGWR